MPNTNDISRVIPEMGPDVTPKMLDQYKTSLELEVERATGLKVKRSSKPVGRGRRNSRPLEEL